MVGMTVTRLVANSLTANRRVLHSVYRKVRTTVVLTPKAPLKDVHCDVTMYWDIATVSWTR